MLANEKGNMREAYLAFEKLNEERCRFVQSEYQKHGGFGAEIVPEGEARWLIAVTAPGEDRIALAHLIARRFAAYQPCWRETRISRGRKIERMRPMYPNYLFVHVWGIERHARRILSCPGVQRLLCKEDGITPVSVSWEIINDIRAEENERNPLVLRLDLVRGKKHRRKKRGRKDRRRTDGDIWHPHDFDVVAVRPWGFSRSLGTWDEEQAVSALHRALGLAA